MGSGTALAVCAAVGAAVAWGISQYIYSDSDHVRVDEEDGDDPQSFISKYIKKRDAADGKQKQRARPKERTPKIEKESESSSSEGTTALAVGEALLGIARGVCQYISRSNDSDHVRFEAHRHYDDADDEEKEAADYQGIQLESLPDPKSDYDYFKNLQATNSTTCTLKIMSYNVCSREEFPMYERMNAISGLVQLHSPQFICFQEITLDIYNIFQSSSWWGYYHCSVSKDEAGERVCFCILLSRYSLGKVTNTPLGYSKMGRLSVAKIKVGRNKSLVVASGHLKSPCPDNNDPHSKDHKFKNERMLEANAALKILKKYPNVIFCGDMNWDEETDGKFPIPIGWIDAWTELRGDGNGYTFDTQSNKMLKGHRRLRKRLDRIFCNMKGKGFRVDNIDIIGKEAISGVTYKPKKKALPVLPSDHYGLLLTISIC